MGIQLDARFLSLVIHDLRTPLNVIGLTLRLIDQALPKGNPDLDEDLHVVQENVSQIERMLVQLTDYCRLVDAAVSVRAAPFDPRRLMGEVIEERGMRSTAGSAPARLDVRPECPPEVTLDPTWSRLAFQHALTNAMSASADGTPVQVVLGGTADRLVTEVTVPSPPPSSVQPVRLRPDLYERLFGTPHERRGLDLAIAARVSELFGGSARLDISPGRSSTVVIDWPTRLVAS